MAWAWRTPGRANRLLDMSHLDGLCLLFMRGPYVSTRPVCSSRSPAGFLSREIQRNFTSTVDLRLEASAWRRRR